MGWNKKDAHTKPNMATKRGILKLSDFARILYRMVKAAQKSVKLCPRKVGEFVPTLVGPVRGVCRSPAISLIRTELLNQTF